MNLIEEKLKRQAHRRKLSVRVSTANCFHLVNGVSGALIACECVHLVITKACFMLQRKI